MAAAVCISATFLTGRYHGEEWPPSPARLLQALVAGVKTGGYRALWPRVETGLRWLEQQPAPAILARPATRTSMYRLAVPNNDFDFVARDWAAGRAGDPSKLRTMKDVVPRAVDGGVPHVRYVWSLDDGADALAIAALMGPLTECLYSLGWGIDMAYSTLELYQPSRAGYEEWLPESAGPQQLKVPVPGFLDDLEATYQAFTHRTVTMNTDTRPTAYRLQRYQRRGARGCPNQVFNLRSLDGMTQYSKGWHAVMEVAAWLRHASAGALREQSLGVDVDSYVLGHTEGLENRSHRLSFVPLPSVGHPNADGRVRRVMLVEPQTADGETTRRLAMMLSGAKVTDERGIEVCILARDDGSVVIPFYTRSARLWRSVTPVVLHGFNSGRGKLSLGKTEGLLHRAFEMAGFPPDTIDSLAFQAAPLWNGAGAAAQIRTPVHLQNYPRYHVEVRFREPVVGPVLAGIGRHYGIGVFAARPVE